MKKYFLMILSFIFVAMFIVACGEKTPEPDDKEQGGELPENIIYQLLDEVSEKTNLPDKVFADVELVTELDYSDYHFTISYTTNSENFDNSGKVKLEKEEKQVTVSYTVVIDVEGKEYSKEYSKKITVCSVVKAMEEASNTISFPEIIRGDVTLPNEIGGFEAQWTTSNKSVLTNKGVYTYTEAIEDVELGLSLIYNDGEEFFDKEFSVKVGPYEDLRCIELASEGFTLREDIYTNKVALQKEFDYGVTATWSSNKTIINTTTGEVGSVEAVTPVILTVTFKKGSETKSVNFEVLVHPYDGASNTDHLIIDRAENFKGTFTDVELKDGKVVIKEGKTTGKYESIEFDTLEFEELVATWACVTSTKATAELEVSIYTKGAWSKYFTYGEWGLGKVNTYYNQNDTNVSMKVDEIILSGSNLGSKFKYRVTLKRDNASVESPRLSLVAVTLNIPNYSYPVDATNLPKEVDYELPRLYQHDVKVIGSTICSATTTTMLLKYNGHDFAEEAKTYANASVWGEYEHGYIASLVADPGHNSPTYGNWVYNMVTAGAFGEDAYVARMYSWEELKAYLANYGPVGASIAGNFGIYSTNGHLIVVRGYKETANGTVVICNDPNVRGVYYEVTLEIFMNAWRGVVYIIE